MGRVFGVGCGTGVATLGQSAGAVHHEAALAFAGLMTVALEAVLAQQGKHLAAEIRRGPDDK